MKAMKAMKAKAFLALSEAALETILPALFFRKFSFFNPPPVFTFEPRKTMAFAILPLAITDFLIAFFMTFAFMTFAFMAFAFMAFAFMAFMAFMGLAFPAFIAATAFFMGNAIAEPC